MDLHGSEVGGIAVSGSLTGCYNSGKILSSSTSGVYGAIAAQTSSSWGANGCSYIYYPDGKPTTGIGAIPVTGYTVTLDRGCIRYSESSWSYNILGVVGNDKFTITTERDENMPILKWEIGQ